MLRAIEKIIKSIHRRNRQWLLFGVILLLTMAAGASFSYMVTGTPTLLNLFLNGMVPDGNLMIQKEVTHPFGDLYQIPADLDFTFAVELGESYAEKTLETSQGEVVADENGKVTINISADSIVTIYDLADGTEVTVKELLDERPGFTADKESQEITIQKRQENSLTFINDYQPEKADTSSLSVSGEKTLEGREWKAGDSFTFLMEVRRDDSWEKLDKVTITYEEGKDFNRFSFTDAIQKVSFDQAGTYSFRISEVEGTIGGLTYDQAESRFDVRIGDADMDGYLEIQSVESASDNTTVSGEIGEALNISIQFVNRYAPEGSAAIDIEIIKKMDDQSGQEKSPAGYTFELYDQGGELLVTSDPTDTLGETKIRLIFEPDDAGNTFSYALKETDGGETIDGLFYDDKEYRFYVAVADNKDGTVSAYMNEDLNAALSDSGLGPAGMGTASDSNAQKASSSNAEKGEVEPKEEISKCIVANFDFATPGNAKRATESNAEKATPHNAARMVTFDDEYENHEAYEDEAEDEDEDDEEDDSIEIMLINDLIDMFLEKDDSEPEEIEDDRFAFINRYDPEDAVVTFIGSKVLRGRELKEEEFSFLLYQTDRSFNVTEETPLIEEVKNGKDGAFSFTDLSFDKVGTYYYVISENTENPLAGVTYDPHHYRVKVLVEDEDGVLIATLSMSNEFGEINEEILFENTYKALPISWTFGAKKILTGAKLKEGQFHFQLFTADEGFHAYGEPVQTVGNQADGTIEFKELKFTEAGTWHYVLLEDESSEEKGITYDDTIYNIEIQVEDPGCGQLEISDSSVTVNGYEVSEIRFENTYISSSDDGSDDDPDDPVVPDKPVIPDDDDDDDYGSGSSDSDDGNDKDSGILLDPDIQVGSEDVAGDDDSYGPHLKATPDAPSELATPDKPDTAMSSDNPKTGDDSNIWLWLALMAVSAIGIIVVSVIKVCKKFKK